MRCVARQPKSFHSSSFMAVGACVRCPVARPMPRSHITRAGPLGADRDFDGRVTLNETFLYVSRRVKQYLSRVAGGVYVQEVVVYPEGDQFVLFER